MEIILNPERARWEALTQRPATDNDSIRSAVTEILDAVKREGDPAVDRYARLFDHTEYRGEALSEVEIRAATASVPDSLKQAIRQAIVNVERFHEAQLPDNVRVETMSGVVCEQRPVAIERVGLYIPGGTAPLFSTVLMLAVPARVAGCREVTLCTPPFAGQIAPEVLYAAQECGVTRIYPVGGVQAIGAMAYGTQSIRRVDKIFGPGNRYVTLAKQIVGTDTVAIDLPAGPSEVLVVADGTSNPRFVAADLLSQAEHSVDSQSIAVVDTLERAELIVSAVETLKKSLLRREYVDKSLIHCKIIVLDKAVDRLAFAELYAPEHLILSIADAEQVAAGIRCAGSVFVGNFSPESAGDYASGTNHTLPTGGWARSLSGVNTESFFRKITVQRLSAEGLRGLSSIVMQMAQAEGLTAHAEAVRIRLEEMQ